VNVVAGALVTDTVLAAPGQPVVVEVRDADGRVVRGAVVRFESELPPDTTRPYEYAMYVCAVRPTRCGIEDEGRDDGAYYGTETFAIDTTDASGRAQASLRFGTVAGPTGVVVKAVAAGLVDTVAYTVAAGSVAGVVFTPEDTVLFAGVSYHPAARATDRFGNPRPDAVTIDGSGLTRVTSASGDNDGAAPSWSPDGSRIAFHDGGYDQAELYTVTMAGDRVRLAPTAPAKMAMWGKFSPDGQWVYYHGQPTNGQPYRLYRARSDGSAIELVSSDTATDFEWRGSPSPDGTRVVYTRGVYWGSTMLYVLDLATGVSTPLGVGGQSARWSPDGSLIAFVESSDGGTLSVIRRDGAGLRRISPPDRWYAVGFDWSPDGKWIIARGSAELELIDVDAGSALPLPFGARFVQPSWKPSSE
jgi:Tol biopolymer transport system component